ncbi:hypothetical protein [Pseudomonas sp. HMWF006]|uniref:hypothetical protein n=1 Tax=Pseudomonas sp. HMWF006 TaxID=2056843 RepID=UPI00211544B9|nr:hypothetical protein [Pseudomonas sp. HMWF006]
MKILLVCKDIGGYAGKLADYLMTEHDVCFIDTSSLSNRFDRAPKILRRPLKRWAQLRQFKKVLGKAARFDVALISTRRKSIRSNWPPA